MNNLKLRILNKVYNFVLQKEVNFDYERIASERQQKNNEVKSIIPVR